MTRYIVVVHGIGEQRKNETILSVVNRFAEARRMREDEGDPLTLGLASGQTGKERTFGGCRYPPLPNDFLPWLEFDGIPQTPVPPAELGPFLGAPASSGENLRFVDLWWADVPRRDFPDVGQPPRTWAQGLIDRLEEKNVGAGDAERVPAWAMATVTELKELLGRVEQLLGLRAKNLRRQVFDDFLGDVQLYGEYAHTRGEAVRRFHRVMARVEAAHTGPEEPRYTVIAHSLGSIMSLDALMYGHAREDLRRQTAAGGVDLPFPAYARPGDATPDPKCPMFDTGWVKRVDSFVTLGSPIDKYLVLWWLNYRYLNVPRDWMDPAMLAFREKTRIRHYNYCDEQDPVGHNLDVAAKAAAVRTVFQPEADCVFNRYAVPGKAHNDYWGDGELFAWILRRAVDDAPGGAPPRWFSLDIYRKALLYTYRVLPFALVAVGYFLLTWAVYAKDWHSTAIATLLLLATVWIGAPLLRLSVWWRQISRLKWSVPDEAERRARKAAGLRFRYELAALQAVTLPLSTISFVYSVGGWGEPRIDRPGQLLLIVAMLLVVPFLYHKITGWRPRAPGPGAIDRWLGTCIVLALLVATPVSYYLLPTPPPLDAENTWWARNGGRLFFNVFLLSTVAAVTFTFVRSVIWSAKEALGVGRGTTGELPKVDFARYADAAGVEIAPPPRRPASRGKKKKKAAKKKKTATARKKTKR